MNINIFIWRYRNLRSSVNIVTRQRAGQLELNFREGHGMAPFFSLPLQRERLWGPPSLLSNGHHGLLPPAVKLTTHVHLMPRLRRRGAIPPFHLNILMAWCLVNQRNNCTLYCHRIEIKCICFTVYVKY
jgi:hypothetical protein